MIVAVILLSGLALLSLLALGLVGMAIKSNGKLVFDSKTVAIPPKLIFHVEYCPSDRSIPSAGDADSGECSTASPGDALSSNARTGPGG